MIILALTIIVDCFVVILLESAAESLFTEMGFKAPVTLHSLWLTMVPWIQNTATIFVLISQVLSKKHYKRTKERYY